VIIYTSINLTPYIDSPNDFIRYSNKSSSPEPPDDNLAGLGAGIRASDAMNAASFIKSSNITSEWHSVDTLL
jgi:hypothetical protein